jgi:hypothetical protein
MFRESEHEVTRIKEQPLLVGNSHPRKTHGDGTETHAFRRDVLLTFHVRGVDNEAQAVQGWIVKFVILQNRFKRAALATVIQLNLCQLSGDGIWEGTPNGLRNFSKGSGYLGAKVLCAAERSQLLAED